MQALVVEDDQSLARAVAHILEREGYAVDAVHDGATGLDYALAADYDIIVFDVMLPLLDGVSAVAALRKRGVAAPVLMLTAKSGVPDRIAGLDGGADAYMPKPFDAGELAACVRALTRRVSAEKPSVLTAGDLRLDERSRVLSCGAEEFQLINKEFLLARLLMGRAGSVATREAIAEEVWRGEPVEANAVEAYVSMLRKKLRHLHSTAQIKAVRGVGYKLVPQEGSPC